jgi:hypothetical protein
MARRSGIGRTVKRRPRSKGRDGNNNPFDGVDNFAEGITLTAIAVAGIPTVGAFSWYYFTGWWRVFAVTLALASGAGLGGWIWAEAAPRSVYDRLRATISTILGFTAIAVHTAVSPLTWWRIWLPLTGVAIAWWCIPKTPAVRGRGGDHHAQDTLAEQLGIGGTKARTVHVSDDGVRKTLALTHRDHPVKEVQGAIEALAAKAGLPPGGIRVVGDRGDAGRSRMTIVTKDVLTATTAWPGPSAPGESWAVPARIGVREDGTPLELLRPGPHGEMASTAVQGIKGAGKTEGELCEVAELVTRRDVVIWWADARKADQTLPDIRPAVDWAARTIPEIRGMVAAIQRAVTARAGWLGARGLRQWTPDCGIPGLLVVFEEAAAVMESLDRTLKGAAETVRSTGIALSVSMQRWTGSNAGDEGTDLRSQLDVGWCFRIKDDDDGEFVLDKDVTMAAGASPSAFSKPGMCYLEAWHVDQDEWSMPGRTYRLDAETLRRHVASWAPRMARLDETTARALGPGYEKRETVSVSEWMADLETRGLGIGPARGRRIVSVSPMAVTVETPPGPETETGDDEDVIRQEIRDELAGIEDELDETGEPRDGDGDGDETVDVDALRADLARDDAEALSGIAEVQLGDLNLTESTYSERLTAFLRWVQKMRLPAKTRTGAGVDWFMQHGLDPSAGRPAWTRIMRRLVSNGGAEDRGYGKWTMLPTAPGLLSEWIDEGDVDTDSDDADDEPEEATA